MTDARLDHPVVLAIDIGTSSVRALICDAGGRALAGSESQIPYVLATDQHGAATFAPDALLELLYQVIDDAVSHAAHRSLTFTAVGVTSFWHSLVGLDDTGAPITPIYYWADSRADDTIDELRTRADWTAIRDRTGCRLHSSYWPAKIHWLRQTERDVTARVRHWVSFTDLFEARLLAEDALQTSVSMASGTGCFNVHDCRWDETLLSALALDPAQFPTVVDLERTSTLRRSFADRWPALAGVPWLRALGDGACANIGSGAISNNRIALTLGTSGAMRIITPAPPGAAWRVPDELWAYRLDREHAVLGGALSNGGNFRRWLSELTGTFGDTAATRAVAKLPPDGHGLTLLPFVAGERSPGWHPDATGAVTGLTLATSAIDLVRAGLEAVAYRFAQIYDALLPITTPDHQIVANGGAIVSSPEWTQIIASVLNRDILTLPAGDEATARGAALMALRTAGVLPDLASVPDPALLGSLVPARADHVATYRTARERQSTLERLLYPPT